MYAQHQALSSTLISFFLHHHYYLHGIVEQMSVCKGGLIQQTTKPGRDKKQTKKPKDSFSTIPTLKLLTV